LHPKTIASFVLLQPPGYPNTKSPQWVLCLANITHGEIFSAHPVGDGYKLPGLSIHGGRPGHAALNSSSRISSLIGFCVIGGFERRLSNQLNEISFIVNLSS